MTVNHIISQLGEAGIKIWLDEENQLRFKAPKGALNDDLKSALIANKAAIIQFLQESTQSKKQALSLAPRNTTQQYPLSFAQQRFWFLERLQPGNASLHIAAHLKLTGIINIAALEQSFTHIIARHETLRTTIVVDENKEVWQKIHAPFAFQFSSISDLSNDDNTQKITHINEIIKTQATQAFDFNNNNLTSLLRCHLIKIAKNNTEYILTITLHHLVADGISLPILINDVSHYYALLTQSAQTPIPTQALSAQYIDYSHWQQQWMQSTEHQTQLHYWQEQLQDTALLNLSTDFTRPKDNSSNGSSLHFTLNADCNELIKATALAHNTSPFTIFLTTFSILLFRYTQQTDICIGTPVAGRQYKEFEPLIGCFINLLAIRNTLSGQDNFIHHLQQTTQTLLTALQHQDLPFEVVAEHCVKERSLAHSPLFQVLFTYANHIQQQKNIDQLNIELLEQPSFTAKYDMQLHINENQQTFTGSIEYNTALFKTATIERFAQHYSQLLTELLHQPMQAINSLAFLTPTEIKQQLDFKNGWNATQFTYPETNYLQEIIEQQADLTPNAIAVIDQQQQLTYQELNTAANRLAHYLLLQNSNAPIAIKMQRSINMSVALLAILKAGVSYIPLATDIPNERLQFILNDTHAKLLICDNNTDDTQLNDIVIININNTDIWSHHSTDNIKMPASTDAIFNIIYTSGSTGNPKGVMVTHQGIINRLRWMQHEYPLNTNDSILQKTPYNFDVSVWELFWPLMVGAKIVFAKHDGHKDPQYLRDIIFDKKITTLHFVPSMLGIFLEMPKLTQCTSIKRVFTSGEALQIEHNKTFFEQLPFAELHNLYGPTEAAIDVSYYACHAQEKNRSIPIGKAIHNTQLHILDANLQLLPQGCAGELYIGGIGLALGYVNLPELSALSFIDNPFYTIGHPSQKLYKTGDVVRQLDDGNIEYLGRNDHQVKIRGFRIELGEIEAQLRKLPNIKDAVVIDKKINQQTVLIAYLVCQAETLSNDEYLALLKTHLPDYMLPTGFYKIESMPLSSNGKVDRKQLPNVDLLDLQSKPFLAPRNAIEQQMAAIWQTTLQINTIGVLDNFFELGGQSLLALKLIANIEPHFAIQLPVKTLFEKPCIADICEFIKTIESSSNATKTVLTIADRTQDTPLSFAQERLWIIEQMNPGNTAYHIAFALDINGELNQTALEYALTALVSRHEALRTTIITNDDGKALQHINSASLFSLKQLSCNSEEQLQQCIDAENTTPFNFSNELLFRASLIRLNSQHHVLAICMHHIISDAWSLNILQNELETLYTSYPNHHSLTDLHYQYVDFTVWQRQQNDSNEHLSYWVEQLHNIPACINLPFDKARPQQQTFNGALLNTQLPNALYQSLQQYCRTQQTTPFMVLMSVYALLLNHYARQSDICIGTPVSGREKSALQNIIGYFVNAVIIRHQFKGNLSFNKLVSITQENALAAFKHQAVAIEKVLDSLNLQRSTSYAPVAQVGFSYLDKGFNQALSLNGASAQLIPNTSIIAKYELTLIAIENDEGLQLNYEYNTDLFNPQTIDTLQTHFIHLLSQCLTSPNTNLNDISLLTKEQCFAAVDADHNIEAVLPLTAMQQDMVMSQWLNPTTLANTLGYRAEVDFAVDPSKWLQALQCIANTQNIPRTQFKTSKLSYGDFAYQCILKQLDVHLEIIDCQNQTLSNAEIQQQVDQFIYRPEAYLQQQFIRYGLLQLANSRTILLLSSHHALLDGISIVLIAEATARQYELLSSNDKALDATLNNNFTDYIQYNRQQTDTAAIYDFWQSQLSSCAPLTFTGSRTQLPTQIIKTHNIPKDVWLAIKRYARIKKTTAAILLKSLYAYLISQYCHASDKFYLSEFQAGRDKNFIQSLGCFFTPSPFIFDASLITNDSTIDTLLSYARDYRKTIKAFDHISSGLTFKLAPQSNLHFMFNYYHFFPQNQLLDNHPIHCIETPPFIDNTVQFVVKEKAEYCELDLYYQSNCFNDYALLERITYLCEQLIAGTSTLADLSLVLDHEKQQQLVEWNNTATPTHTFKNLAQSFEQQATLTPNTIAIIDDKTSISFAKLNEQANQLAHYLISTRHHANEYIGVCMDRNIDAICAILAIVKSGAAYVPIDSQYPVARIQHMLNEAKIERLFTQQEYQHLFTQQASNLICIDDVTSPSVQLIQQQPTNNPNTNIVADSPLYVIFTSGSTGLPKGACVTHAGEINLLTWYSTEFEFNASSVNLIISALGFDLTQKNIFAPLISGGKLLLTKMQHYDSDHIAKLIAQHQVSHINCAPSAFYPLAEAAQYFTSLAPLRYLIVGGESINSKRFNKWLTNPLCQAQLVNNYGPTECTDIAAFYRVNDIHAFAKKVIPVGKPNHNVQCYILNSHSQLLPTGLQGEICVAGAGVGLGYVNNPQLTNDKFVNNPFAKHKMYRTGDIGSLDEEGNIIFHHRQDHQVKINGMRIELGEIEFAIKNALNATDALAVVINNAIYVYMLNDNAQIAHNNWKELLAEYLPKHMLPSNIMSLSHWPLTANGKIDRKALPDIEKTATAIEYIAPRDEVETIICDIVQRILSIERVGVLDNFFDLGGHSLAASRAIVQIREHFQMDIPLNILFEMTTVEKLAAYIKATQWVQQSANQSENEENRDTGFI